MRTLFGNILSTVTYMKDMKYVMVAPKDAHEEVMSFPAMNLSKNAITQLQRVSGYYPTGLLVYYSASYLGIRR